MVTILKLKFKKSQHCLRSREISEQSFLELYSFFSLGVQGQLQSDFWRVPLKNNSLFYICLLSLWHSGRLRAAPLCLASLVNDRASFRRRDEKSCVLLGHPPRLTGWGLNGQGEEQQSKGVPVQKRSFKCMGRNRMTR